MRRRAGITRAGCYPGILKVLRNPDPKRPTMFVAGIDAHATYSVIAIVSNTGQLVQAALP